MATTTTKGINTMTIICIDAEGFEDQLTPGKLYGVISAGENDYDLSWHLCFNPTAA